MATEPNPLSFLSSCPRCHAAEKTRGAAGVCDIYVGFHIWHYTPPDLPPTGTHVSGPSNSTRFTDCCGCAVNRRGEGYERCPSCLREVRA